MSHYDQLTKHYGAPCNASNHVQIKIFGKVLTVHKDAVRFFRRVDLVFKNKAPRYYKSILGQPDIGAYACRMIAGTQTRSLHSWPLAIDIDWQQNAYGDESGEIEEEAMAAVRQLEREGFTWGGRFNTPDPMHFELGIHMTPDWLRDRYNTDGSRKDWWRKETS